MKRYGVGLIGAGWVGAEYVRACRDHPALELIGIHNRTPGRATKLMQEFGVVAREYATVDELFDDERVDVVVSATTPDVRLEHVVRAAETGRHIVAEKPLALRVEDLEPMCAAVRAAGVKSITSFVLRFNPQIATSRQLVSDGVVGDVVYAEADYWNPSDPAWPGYGWLRTKDLGGSAFITGGCHAVDVIRYLAGEITEVSAFSAAGKRNPDYEYDPVVVASVRFAHGGVGKVSAVLDGMIPYHFNTRVIGTRGSIQDNELWAPRLLPGATVPFRYPTITPDTAEVGHHPFYAELDHFVDCIETGVESHASIPDAAKSMAAVFAIDASHQAGGTVVRVADIAPGVTDQSTS